MRNVSAHAGKLNFCDAKKLEKDGSRLVSAKLGHRLLLEPAISAQVQSVGKFWTGTVVAYPKAGLPFGYEVRVSNRPLLFLLDTKDFRGERNLALAFTDFEILEDGRERIYHPKEIIPIPDFPNESGWCSLHESGVPMKNGKYNHYLWRWEAERVGPLVLAFGNSRKDVFIHHRPSEKLHALFERGQPAQEADVIPIQAARK